jgi:transcriptional regulator with XRE-family HTH domain
MAEKLAVKFGKRIRALRVKRGWRQIDLAAHADTSRQHVSGIELGRREVCLNVIERLAAALDVQPHELFR